MSTIAERARENLGLKFYDSPNFSERVGQVALTPPAEKQYVLRCPIKVPGSELLLPGDMEWTRDFIDRSLAYQRQVVGVDQPYTYLTIRHGLVESVTDDEWHVDGFSVKIPHIPEQNYVWVDHTPTEEVAFGLNFPDDFDPMVHNLHQFIQDTISEDAAIRTLDAETIYAMDPYVFHRRPEVLRNIVRTFLRLSCTPIPIDDINNHINPAFGVIITNNDGIVDFRDHLLRYPLIAA